MDTHISFHLLGVVRTLRTADATGPRGRLLDALDGYARAGRFPRWDTPIAGRRRPRRPRRFHGPGRRAPRFRDPQGTWCAVGYLMSLTDPALAAELARRFEDRWLAEMDEPRIAAWAERHGFTLDELAWIQPGYCFVAPMCDELPAIEETLPTDAASCAGADVRAQTSATYSRYCQDGCDGPMRVWLELHNLGEVDATGVAVELWGETATNPLDATQVDVPARGSLLVELTSASVDDIGYGGGVTVHDPDGCIPDPMVSTVWTNYNYNYGVGIVMPEACGGSCANDTGPFRDTDSGSPHDTDSAHDTDAETPATGDTSTPPTSPPTDTATPDAEPTSSAPPADDEDAHCGCDGTGSSAGLWLTPLLLAGTRRRSRHAC